MTEPELEAVGREQPEVLGLFAEFIRESDGPLGIDLETEIAAGPPPELDRPDGVLLLARVGGEPAGIGGVRFLDTEAAEVKSMYVAPAFRGRGIARALLAELERIAREHGCARIQLDTSDYLTEAIALYRSAGYREVPDYNRNPKANLWFERSLVDEPVRIVPYDPAWPERFSAEKAALGGAIGDLAVGGIHHVGSTAVPGLEAKPTIDVLVGVESLEGSRGAFEPLAALDYVHAPYLPEQMHWFCKPDAVRREFHLHLVPVGSRRYEEELVFRDRLRADPELAGRYAALKHELADRFGEDREGYTEAKSDFIRAALIR